MSVGAQPNRPLNERYVSIDLIGEPNPALPDIVKDFCFGLARRQFHQAKAFSRLIAATLGTIHLFSSKVAIRNPVSGSINTQLSKCNY
jgi:hypothetical protein